MSFSHETVMEEGDEPSKIGGCLSFTKITCVLETEFPHESVAVHIRVSLKRLAQTLSDFTSVKIMGTGS